MFCIIFIDHFIFINISILTILEVGGHILAMLRRNSWLCAQKQPLVVLRKLVVVLGIQKRRVRDSYCLFYWILLWKIKISKSQSACKRGGWLKCGTGFKCKVNESDNKPIPMLMQRANVPPRKLSALG